jgi:hypothetical protein
LSSVASIKEKQNNTPEAAITRKAQIYFFISACLIYIYPVKNEDSFPANPT